MELILNLGGYCNMVSRHTVQPGAAVSLRLRDLLATNCSKLY